jgi:hypothetical protein
MTVFIYKGLRDDGIIVEGEFHARVPQDAYRKMELLGLRPILVHEVGPEVPQTDADGATGELAGLIGNASA